MKKIFAFLLCCIISLLLIGCNDDETTDVVHITVSAAISLTEALDDIQKLYEQDHAIELTFNLGGSGTLAQQIQQGAPVDVFISANQEWMNTLENQDLINRQTRTNITGNKLVLITGINTTLDYPSFSDISSADVKKIAIGNPESVPAGEYAKTVLKHLSLWDELEDKLVFAKNVRQVVTYVETENTDIGIVYESDVVGSKDIKILATAEEDTHEPIIYPAAMITDTKNEQEAEAFIKFLETDEAQKIFAEHGLKR
ncbi:MAG TPA: molybdate ABC transporter substrate-binding protein [Virgibacillus sp.]|nr:molybdate ABC transporter substrate-binding protein [Virgibacillus sp.]